jgi:hypothetical protein
MKTDLCPWFELAAIAEDRANGDFVAVVNYRDVAGGVRTAHLPLTTLDDEKALRRVLTNKGAYLSEDEGENRKALGRLRRHSRSAPSWIFAPRLGWYDPEFTVFVRPNEVIGDRKKASSVRPPRTLGAQQTLPSSSGTLDGWQQYVADPAEHSSRMVLGICAAFAAPLLKLAGLPSFAIFVTGGAKMAKSTVTVVAASTIGLGAEEDLPNFRSTDAALIEMPVTFNDSLLPLNELGLLRGRSTERRQRIRELTYALGEGRGTTYSQFVRDQMRTEKFHTIVLANGEETSDDLARSGGDWRMAGETVRWIDLPAASTDCPDVFDRSPKGLTPEKRTAWFEKTCRDLRRHCTAHHGIAIRHFLEHVIRKREIIEQELPFIGKAFVNDVSSPDDDNVVRHLAQNFGHLFAAGIFAVRAGTVPWSEKLVKVCIRRCFRDARRELNTADDVLRDGLVTLQMRIKRSTISLRSAKKMSPELLEEIEGYHELSWGRNRVTVRTERFKAWFPDPRQPRLVLQWLASQGALPNRSSTDEGGLGILWAQSQPAWPDSLRHRSICLDLRGDVLSRSK